MCIRTWLHGAVVGIIAQSTKWCCHSKGDEFNSQSEYCFYFHAVWINGFQIICLGFYIIVTLYYWLPGSEKHAVYTPKNIHNGNSVALSGATLYRWWHTAPNLQWAVRKNSTYFEGGQSYCSSLKEQSRQGGQCWQHGCGVIWNHITLKIYCLREKLPFLRANLNKFEFFCDLMGHPNKIWLFPCMPAVIWTY
jgi:hypothetical protein